MTHAPGQSRISAGVTMDNDEKELLWNEINDYVRSCNGDPSRSINAEKIVRVANIEAILRGIILSVKAEMLANLRDEVIAMNHRSDGHYAAVQAYGNVRAMLQKRLESILSDIELELARCKARSS